MKKNTKDSFRDKWRNNASAYFGDTLREGSDTQAWILKRNGYKSLAHWTEKLSACSRILDAGCGNGRVTALLHQIAPSDAVITGIDLVAADVARGNFLGVENVHFETRDLVGDLTGLGKFDYIYCQEVLHHTSDPRLAFRNVSSLLADNGELAIYVYKVKAPVREFVDDFVRDRISSLGYQEALEKCKQITEFGRALSEIGVNVTVPDVDILGIEAGEYDIQRLVYHFFAKCYWNPDLSDNENVVINYDWYHPQISTRHTLEEVEAWFSENGLSIVHRCVDHYGITIRGRRQF